ncbi:T9SS-dependent choice-of-anchor J family protein [Xanthomarina sp. GH4-25]|uniref:T9SS-dependent choice-of-anchor J family protein n=1 Tax=Xanthomarina sp. GH4-25 TaxID=3349335 RepID=UPI000D6771C0|nr:hypothetical protein DI383_11285 [Flavobacteriaceae bacterium LYZ1037]
MRKITLLIMGFLAILSANSQIVLSENFDDITTLTDWDQVNVSTTLGSTNWFQGNDAVFSSYNGGPTSYIGANFNATTGTGTISNWLILPVLSLKDDDVLTFYTRTSTGSIYPDRLQVRVSADGAASVAPTNDSDEGSYTTLLLDINPTLTVGGYPNADWELQTVTISGLGSTAIDARLAFRYYVASGGPSGTNSNFIGIDAVEVNETLSIDEYAQAPYYKIGCNNQYISIYNINDVVNYKLISLTGQQLLEGKTSNKTHTIDATTLTSGVYVIEISNPQTNAVYRKKIAF